MNSAYNFPGGLTSSPEPSFTWPSWLVSGPDFAQTPPIISGSNAGVPGAGMSTGGALADAASVGQTAAQGALHNLLFWAILAFVIGLMLLGHISWREIGR